MIIGALSSFSFSTQNKWVMWDVCICIVIEVSAYHKFLLTTSFFLQRHSFFVLFEVFSLRRLKIKPCIGKCFHVGKKGFNKRMKFVLKREEKKYVYIKSKKERWERYHNFTFITDYSKTNQIKETVCIIMMKNELYVFPYKNNENVYDIN